MDNPNTQRLLVSVEAHQGQHFLKNNNNKKKNCNTFLWFSIDLAGKCETKNQKVDLMEGVVYVK